MKAENKIMWVLFLFLKMEHESCSFFGISNTIRKDGKHGLSFRKAW